MDVYVLWFTGVDPVDVWEPILGLYATLAAAQQAAVSHAAAAASTLTSWEEDDDQRLGIISWHAARAEPADDESEGDYWVRRYAVS